MTGEFLNPVRWEDIESDMTEAEEHFVECLAQGKPCALGNAVPQAQETGTHNTIRSEVIRFFAYGGDKEHLVRGAIIDLRGAWICGKEALDLKHANISYALGFFGCHFAVGVDIRHAECIALHLDGSCLAQGLLADRLTTRGGVNLRYGFSAEGEVRLVGASIGGSLSCSSGKFHNTDGNAFSADRLTTKGTVHMNEDFSAKGGVRLTGANIGGALDCGGGTFHNTDHNTDGYALFADSLTTKDSVHLSGSFSAEGEVRLVGASIGGSLICLSGKFNNSGGYALSADGLTTKHNVHLSGDFSAEGEVRLLGASIGGHLDCEGGKFYNPDGNALIVDGGNISGGLFWRNTTCKGDVSLAYARADVLADDSDSWELCKIDLDGFTYNRFVDSTDAQSRIDWLAKRPDRMGFSPLPYEQAAKVLFGMGHASDAREILLEKERRQTADKRTPPFWKFWRELWNIFSGYGYRLRYTAAWMSFFVFVGAFIFWFADESGCIVPNRPIVLANSDYNNAVKDADRQSKCPDAVDRPTSVTKRLFPDYPEFNAFVYSLDVFIPVFALHQEPNWHPGPCLNRDLTLRFLSWWHWLEIIAGWILTSLLLLSVTGLLRPRQSSGEKD